jgi:sulfoxide reductase heme-binding subunit YedZ
MAWMPGSRQILAIKASAFLVALLPFAWLAWGAFTGGLGTNPIEKLTRDTGWWCLVLLLATLALTPLRKLAGLHWVLRLRRMLGLYSFFYGALHFTTFIWFDHWFDLMEMLKDVVKRPFITVGFVGFVLMLPLALTSTNAMVRRLGGRNWQRLHRLAYAAPALGVLHYWWLVKADISQPLIFGTLLSLLLGLRLWWRLRERRPGQARPSAG